MRDTATVAPAPASASERLWQCVRERRMPSVVSNTYVRAYAAWGRAALERRGYLDFLRTRPAAAIRPMFADLWFLYRLVRARRPACVLEFGSGCSTIVLGYALRDAGGGHLYSVDTDPFWAEAAAAAVPAELRDRVTVTCSPVEPVTHHGVAGWRHGEVPDIVPDLLYLDGPPLSRERSVAVDPVELEARFPPGFVMVVDGRRPNVEFLKRHLRRRYRVRERRRFHNTVFELAGGSGR